MNSLAGMTSIHNGSMQSMHQIDIIAVPLGVGALQKDRNSTPGETKMLED